MPTINSDRDFFVAAAGLPQTHGDPDTDRPDERLATAIDTVLFLTTYARERYEASVHDVGGAAWFEGPGPSWDGWGNILAQLLNYMSECQSREFSAHPVTIGPDVPTSRQSGPIDMIPV